ncbi:MAG: hypothetical protein WBG86_06575, partial [Polyangiales bacterium]
PYPRVRAVAARALTGDEATMMRRATLARRDPWPLVRAESVTSLEGDAVAMPVVVAAVDDPMSAVRSAAIAVLVGVPDDTGWSRVHARLRKHDEWPEVTAAAIEYVVAHCRTDAVEALFVVIRRAASPSPRTDDLNNAARAIEALRVLQSPESEAALEHLRGAEGVPPTLKMALEEPIADLPRCPVQAP